MGATATVERAKASALARRAVCDPRGAHRPVMTRRFVVEREPRLYRLCGDCHAWVDPTPIHAQSTVGGAVVMPDRKVG